MDEVQGRHIMKTDKKKMQNMKTILRCSLATLVLIGLSGCGLKGPLYFPPAEKPAGSSKAVPAKGPTLTTTQTGENVDKNQNISGQ